MNLYFKLLLVFLVVFCTWLIFSLDKLSARAIKCVFLGYYRLQERYRCYSPETKRYYMSANVNVFEVPSLHEVDYVQQIFPIIVVEPGFRLFTTLQVPLQLQTFLYNFKHTRVIVVTHQNLPMLATTDWSHITWWVIFIKSFTIITEFWLLIMKILVNPLLSKRVLVLPVGCNPHLIYNFLDYHRAFASYFSFILCVFYYHFKKHD